MESPDQEIPRDDPPGGALRPSQERPLYPPPCRYTPPALPVSHCASCGNPEAPRILAFAQEGEWVRLQHGALVKTPRVETERLCRDCLMMWARTVTDSHA